MQLLGIEWERVNTKKMGRVDGDGGNPAVILLNTKKNPTVYTRMEMSTALVEDTGWKADDRVTLYKQGTKLFLLKREPVGLLTIKQRKGSKRLSINSTDACRNLYPSQNGVKFEATYDKDIDAVILMPAKQ